MQTNYDVIVVGARCGGSPTAMLLARRGHRVLVIDRAEFPSDTTSTLMIHAPGIDALRRWGLLDRVVATGCPPISRYSFDFGPFTIKGAPRTRDGEPAVGYAPRRTLLDKILVDAAREAGVDVREHVTFEDVITDDDAVIGIRGHTNNGTVFTERARVVVGADGFNSRVARAVHATAYHTKPMLEWAAYTYWQDLPADTFSGIARPDRGFGIIPTNDDLTLLIVGWPAAEQAAYKTDVERNYLGSLDVAPDLAEAVRSASRVDRFTGGGVPNFFRAPFGPGWVLVGDAGYTKDPITAQGISDAFHDAEACADTLDDVLAGRVPFDEAMAAYHRARDERALPMFELTAQLATLEPPPPEVQQLLGAVAQNSSAMDEFVSVMAGTMSPPEFFDPAHVAEFLADAKTGVSS
jgi:2-polyprenyl-6-methoxyphenol hydroxylase-like FAD-dependent oxidoreductase